MNAKNTNESRNVSRVVLWVLLFLVVIGIGWGALHLRNQKVSSPETSLKPALPAEPIASPREVAELDVDSQHLQPVASGTPLSILRLQSYVDSGIETPRKRVINTDSQWMALQTEMGPNAQTLPDFNPKKETAIGIFIGTRASGGYSVSINSIQQDASRVLVDYTENRPDPDALTTQALTTPGILVIIPKSKKTIVFHETDPSYEKTARADSSHRHPLPH